MHAVEIADGDDRPDQPVEARPVRPSSRTTTKGWAGLGSAMAGDAVSVDVVDGPSVNDTLTDLRRETGPSKTRRFARLNRIFNPTLLRSPAWEGGRPNDRAGLHSTMATVAAAQAVRRAPTEGKNGCRSFDADPRGGRLQHHDPHHPQFAAAARIRGRRRRAGRLRRALQDAPQAIRPGDLRLEHGADDRLRAAQAGALRPEHRARRRSSWSPPNRRPRT